MLSARDIAANKLVFVFYVYGCGLGKSLADCSGSRVHKIDPYMVICILLYEGRSYALYIRLTLIRERGSVLYLGMATEILNLP